MSSLRSLEVGEALLVVEGVGELERAAVGQAVRKEGLEEVTEGAACIVAEEASVASVASAVGTAFAAAFDIAEDTAAAYP